MDANNFQTRLRRCRMAAGMQGKELASRSGISSPYLTQLEKGQRLPSEDLLNRLAHELQVTSHWLLHGDHHQHARLTSPADTQESNHAEPMTVREDRDDAYGSLESLRRENAELRERAARSERREAELLEIVRNLTAPAAGRTRADAPATPAYGAVCGTNKKERAEA